MNPVMLQFILGLAIAVIERAPQAIAASQDFVRAVKALMARGDDPTAEELGELTRRALEAGASLRETVLVRLSPGGDWHGKLDLPDEIAELVGIASGKVSGGAP